MLRLPREPNAGEKVRASDMRLLIRYLRAITPRSSGSVLVQSGPGGTTFQSRSSASSSSSASAATFPFQVSTRVNPSNPSLSQARVEYNSSLLRDGYVLDNRQTITGLTQLNSDGTINDASWFYYEKGNDLIWLEVTLNNLGAATAATICSYGLGGSWHPHDGPGTYTGTAGTGAGAWQYQLYYDANANPYYQQYVARIQIFSSVSNGSGIVETQLLNSNLKMCGDYFSGLASDGTTNIVAALTMPFPYAGPYVAGA